MAGLTGIRLGMVVELLEVISSDLMFDVSRISCQNMRCWRTQPFIHWASPRRASLEFRYLISRFSRGTVNLLVPDHFLIDLSEDANIKVDYVPG